LSFSLLRVARLAQSYYFPTLRSSDLEREALKKYYIDIDHHLHTKILESCSNRYLKTIMRNVYDHDQRIRMRTSDPLIDQNSTIRDRKSTRLNSSHVAISYDVFCVK